VELSSGPAAQSRHHLRTVRTTAEGRPFTGTRRSVTSDIPRLRTTLTYLCKLVFVALFLLTNRWWWWWRWWRCHCNGKLFSVVRERAYSWHCSHRSLRFRACLGACIYTPNNECIMCLPSLHSRSQKKLQRIIYRAVKRSRNFSLAANLRTSSSPGGSVGAQEHVDKGTAVSLRRVAH